MIILNPNGAHPKAFEKLPVVLGAWYLVTVSAGPACEEGGKAHPPAQATAGAGSQHLLQLLSEPPPSDNPLVESDVLTFFPLSIFPEVEKCLMKFLCGLKSLAY